MHHQHDIGPTKNWIAVEGSHSTTYTPSMPKSLPFNVKCESNTSEQSDMKIASSAPRGPQTFEERNVFAIYVSYYVKVKLTLSGMGGEVSLKLPFILGHVDSEVDSATQHTNESKADNCNQLDSGTELYEEECGGPDDGSEIDESKCDIGSVTTNAQQCDTIQLEQQLKLSHINVSDGCASRNDGNSDDDDDDDDDDNGDDDDDDDSNQETCPNIITAQIHANSTHTAPASPTSACRTHSDDKTANSNS